MSRLCGQSDLSVTFVCGLFDHTRQAYYQKKWDWDERMLREGRLLDAVAEIRQHDPGVGGYKLWLMMKQMFRDEWVPGRDSFYSMLRLHGFTLKRPKPRHTTNSNHRYHKYKNLTESMLLTASDQLWVSDITYIDTCDGCCYLHLVTDAYSHKIIGWCLSETLQAIHTIEALRMAINSTGKSDLSGLIHHSDRGVQYCCDAYVAELQQYGIRISMTEDYNPTKNGLAERVNGIIKNEYLYREKRLKDFAAAQVRISEIVMDYNQKRLHSSVGYQTPASVQQQTGPQRKMWH